VYTGFWQPYTPDEAVIDDETLTLTGGSGGVISVDTFDSKDTGLLILSFEVPSPIAYLAGGFSSNVNASWASIDYCFAIIENTWQATIFGEPVKNYPGYTWSSPDNIFTGSHLVNNKYTIIFYEEYNTGDSQNMTTTFNIQYYVNDIYIGVLTKTVPGLVNGEFYIQFATIQYYPDNDITNIYVQNEEVLPSDIDICPTEVSGPGTQVSGSIVPGPGPGPGIQVSGSIVPGPGPGPGTQVSGSIVPPGPGIQVSGSIPPPGPGTKVSGSRINVSGPVLGPIANTGFDVGKAILEYGVPAAGVAAAAAAAVLYDASRKPQIQSYGTPQQPGYSQGRYLYGQEQGQGQGRYLYGQEQGQGQGYIPSQKEDCVQVCETNKNLSSSDGAEVDIDDDPLFQG
jgi:hypothetical protein